MAEVWRSSSRPRLKNGLGFRVERAGVAILSAVLRTMSIAPVVSRFVLRFGAWRVRDFQPPNVDT